VYKNSKNSTSFLFVNRGNKEIKSLVFESANQIDINFYNTITNYFANHILKKYFWVHY